MLKKHVLLKLTIGIMLVSSIGLGVYGLYKALTSLYVVSSYETVVGNITGCDISRSQGGGLKGGSSVSSTVYAPVIKLSDGRVIESLYYSGRDNCKIGEKVEVLANPLDAEDLRINKFGDLWLGALVMIIISTVFSVILFPLFKHSQKLLK